MNKLMKKVTLINDPLLLLQYSPGKKEKKLRMKK